MKCYPCTPHNSNIGFTLCLQKPAKRVKIPWGLRILWRQVYDWSKISSTICEKYSPSTFRIARYLGTCWVPVDVAYFALFNTSATAYGKGTYTTNLQWIIDALFANLQPHTSPLQHCVSCSHTDADIAARNVTDSLAWTILGVVSAVVLKVGANQFSKGPQECDGKLRGHNDLWVGHRDVTAWIKYFKFKIQSKVPPPLHSSQQRRQTVFYCFSTHLIWSNLVAVGWLTCWQQYVTALTLCRLSLATLQPDIQNLALFSWPKEYTE
jgi:hypothetical protein